jgi:hypothetical protein
MHNFHNSWIIFVRTEVREISFAHAITKFMRTLEHGDRVPVPFHVADHDDGFPSGGFSAVI